MLVLDGEPEEPASSSQGATLQRYKETGETMRSAMGKQSAVPETQKFYIRVYNWRPVLNVSPMSSWA